MNYNNVVIGIIIFIIATMITAVSQVLLKLSANDKTNKGIRTYVNLRVIVGYFLLFSTTIFSTIGYRYVNYKLGMVLSSLSYIFIMILSRIILKEKITNNKIVGNIFIILGIILFSVF